MIGYRAGAFLGGFLAVLGVFGARGSWLPLRDGLFLLGLGVVFWGYCVYRLDQEERALVGLGS